jgi:peptide/nickel transport system substrate-binding protein
VNRFVAPAVAAVLTLTLGAPGSGQPARHPYTTPHVLRYATAEDINSLDPHLSSQLTVTYLSSLTMAWLVKSGPHNEPVPELATVVPTKANGGISPDGRTITYHLRRGVKWSDGAPFDADDVVFSIKTVQNPATNEVGRDGWDLIDRIDEPDKFTVAVHLTKPYAGYAYTFFSSMGANPCVLPKHLLGSLTTINDAPYNALPVGIGPFRYVAWHRGDSVELEANPNYFRGLPKLQRIIFKIVPDRNTVLTQLQSHELDLWLPVTANYVDRVKAIPGDDVLREPSFAFDHLDFNLSHPILADLAVRRALEYALDRETIRLKIRHGLGTLSESLFGPTHPDYHPIALVPFDLATARRLLERDGWNVGADGVRIKNGQRLELVFVIPSGVPDSEAIAELIRQTWAQAGVALDVQRYPSNVLFALAADHGIINTGRFDVTLYGSVLDGSGDVSAFFACASIPPAGENVMHFCDPIAERSMSGFESEYDLAQQKPYAYRLTDRLAEQVPQVVLGIRDAIFAYNSDLKNFHPNAVAAFDDMMEVDI